MPNQTSVLLQTLKDRFSKNLHRHVGVSWETIQSKMTAPAIETIQRMEDTGGEPDAAVLPDGTIVYFDFVKETPLGRRSLCYDRFAWNSRKEAKPSGDALSLAQTIGVRMASEAETRFFQTLEPFDLKTSSWIQTPDAIRRLGGALFCDRRYDTVFVYHNGAESYYAARGFRGVLELGQLA